MANEEKKAVPLIINAAAMDAVKQVRASAEKAFGMRPDLTLVAIAMLRAAAKCPDINDEIRAVAMEAYGLKPAEAPAAAS